MTASILKILIQKNRYTYADMYTKLDVFYALGRINDDEYIELTGMLVVPEAEIPTIEE